MFIKQELEPKPQLIKLINETEAKNCFGIPQSYYYVLANRFKEDYVATTSLGSCSFIVALTNRGRFFAAHVMANQIYVERKDLGWDQLPKPQLIKDYLNVNTKEILVISNAEYIEQCSKLTVEKLPNKAKINWIKIKPKGEYDLSVAVKFKKMNFFNKWSPEITYFSGDMNDLKNSAVYKTYLKKQNEFKDGEENKIHQFL